MQKYEIYPFETLEYQGHTLHRIRLLWSKLSHGLKPGALGGWIESAENLSQDGNCWITSGAMVYGNARVSENAFITGKSQVYGNAKVCGSAIVGYHSNTPVVYGNAIVSGNARIRGCSRIHENACVTDNALVAGRACVFGNARVIGKGAVQEDAIIYSNAVVAGRSDIRYNAHICDEAEILEPNQYFVLGPVMGTRNQPLFLTFFRTVGGNMAVECGGFCGDVFSFLDEIWKRNEAGLKVYKKCVQMALLVKDERF